MTSSDGHVGRVVGKRYRQLSSMEFSEYIRPLKSLKCTLEKTENKHQLCKKHCKYCLNRLSHEKVNYLITLIHINTRP